MTFSLSARLHLPQHQIDDSATAHVFPRLPTVQQDIGVGAAGFFSRSKTGRVLQYPGRTHEESAMSATAKELLSAFDALPDPDQSAIVQELLRRPMGVGGWAGRLER